MIFNSQPCIANLLESAYAAGNCLFAGDYLYAPLANSVKRVDLHKNQTALLPFQLPHHTAIIALSSRGLLLAVDFTGHSVLFNLAGSFVVGEFNFKKPVKQAIFSEEGRMLGVGLQNGFAVYECSGVYRSFEPLVLIKKYKSRHAGNIRGLQFSRDSRFLLTYGQDNVVFLNNLFPLPDYVPFTLQAHRYPILSTIFSHDMAYLYSFDAGSNLFIWKWINETTPAFQNFKEARKRARSNAKGNHRSQTATEDSPQQFDENLSPFEQLVGSGRFILSKKLSLNQGGSLKRIVFKPEMGFLAGAYSNGKFGIWKLVGEELEEVQVFAVGDHKISTIAVNESCTWLAIGIKSLGQLIVWEWKSQSYILNQRGLPHETRELAYNGVSLYATGTGEGSVRLWDSNSCFCVATFTEHQAAVTGLRFSNSQTLFSSSLDGTVLAYDTMKQKKFRTFQPDVRCQLVCLEVDDNGQVVFAGAFDPYDVYSWSVQTGHLLQVISGHQGPLAALAFAQTTLVTASWDNTLKLHAIFARKLNVETLDHGSQVTALALNPAKTQVAVSTMKGEIFLWQAETGRMDGVLQSQMTGGRSYMSKVSADNDPSNKYLKALAYSPCGQYLYGGGKSKYLHVYDISHRMLLTKISLTCNKDIQGVVDKLNSRYVKNGVATYEMELQAQNQVYSDEEKVEKLPGSKKIDISEIRIKLQVEVRKIIVKSSRQILVTTSFGTLLLNCLEAKSIFNPYQLAPSLSPQLIPELFIKHQYTSALLVALKLNINPRKLLKKIPIEHVKAIVSELEPKFAELLIEKICEEGKVSLREATWLQHLLRQGYRPSPLLRGALECLEEQVKLLSQAQGCLELVAELAM